MKKQNIIHLRKESWTDFRTVCGRIIDDNQTTTELSEVTCSQCIKQMWGESNGYEMDKRTL